MRYECLNLSWAFSEYFFSQHGNRQLARELGQLAHPTMPASEAAARRDAFGRAHWIKRRQSKHCAARTIQIAGDDIQNIDQPLAEPAELLSTDANSPITDG